jgi:hypothetical protein
MSYLDILKAKISEHGSPTLLTKPTQAPSVSFVSAPGWHVSENERAEDTPTQYWSDVVHQRFWVAPTAAHAAALAAQGQVAYQPEEIWRLWDFKARDPYTFATKLRAIHQVKTIFGATVTDIAHPTKRKD